MKGGDATRRMTVVDFQSLGVESELFGNYYQVVYLAKLRAETCGCD